MESAGVNAVLFARDVRKVGAFYSEALGLTRVSGDESHVVLNCCGFDLVVHQIPPRIADEAVIESPPERRVWAAIRLSFPVNRIEDCRRLARMHGGELDDAPPEWAGSTANVFLGYDPEGNVFKVSERAVLGSS